MELMEEAIRKDPTLVEKWRAEGERQYQAYLQRTTPGQRELSPQANPIIIPVVFHLVDAAATLAGITDRDIYEQVEQMNRDYSGAKMANYLKVIPPEIAARVGNIPVKFVLARRDPNGNLTTGIERRVNATPDHVSIKANATGGLDAWDVNKYVNIWAGTFSGADAGLLGIATFPFTTGQGAQGVVIGISTLPFTSPTTRSYYPNYSEAATLSHEIGHYFYLFHTFGDLTTCNNQDFRLQAGWPLPTGAGPEGDDTPSEQAGPGNAYFGNPSMNFNYDNCAPEPFGIMYGSYMNYFDDRALFMFSDGMRKRVEGCINLYRPGLLTTDGATPPSAVTDAFLVTVSSRGLPERRSFVQNNTPFSAIVRNNGTTTLTSVTLNVKIDAGAATPTTFPLNLAPGRDTTLSLGTITGAGGNHTYQVYTTSPNGGGDDFLNNDTLYSYYNIHTTTATIPFSEDFSSATFPPTNWQMWNPNGGSQAWTRNTTDGSTAAGAAFYDNYNINQTGTLDELITPALDLGVNTAAALSFKVAHAVYDDVDVSTWDGLEVYVSGDGGLTYNLAWKKSGRQLKTLTGALTSAFHATPAQPDRWREETINLTPYIVPGQKMIIKFRNVNAFGNNIILDDISVVPVIVGSYDAQISAIGNPVNASNVFCVPVTPVVTIRNASVTTTLTAATINVNLNGTVVGTQAWTGSLGPGASANVTLNTVPITPIVGTNTLKIYTTLPTGIGDANNANDTSTSVFTRTNPVALPVVNDFETALLPTNWTLYNPDGDFTWTRNSPGTGGAGFGARIDNYNNDAPGHKDDIRTPVLSTTGLQTNDSILVTFDLAHKYYPDPTVGDTLRVLVSTDCGATFTTIWTASDPALATAGSTTAPYTAAASGDWKNIRLGIGRNLYGAGPMMVAIQNSNGFGNYTWVDNINVLRKPRVDLQTSAISRPGTTECSAFTPSMTVRNNGEVVITGFRAGYIINNNAPVFQAFNVSLNPGATTTVTFGSATAPVGNNNIKLFVADPISVSPGPDFTISNDTLSKSFFITAPSVNAVVEGFENATFPPTNWLRINPDNSITWQRTDAGKGKASGYSAWVNNYDYATNVYLFDYLQTPVVNTAGADSLIITFDVANQYWTDGVDQSVDNLSVLVSRNCAVSFSTVYSKTGDVLATAGGSGDPYLSPAQADWRRERISVDLISNPASTVITQFRNGDAYGNNTYIDNINITPIFKRDIELLSLSPDVLCTTGVNPVATIRNRGTETITAYKVSYKIGTGAAVTTAVTGVNLAPGATATVPLTAGTLVGGINTITVYSSEPTTVSGTGDMLTFNDTLVRTISVSGSVTAPTNISEGFEGNFLPAGWAVSNPDNSLTWQKGTTGKSSGGSAQVRNFVYYNLGQKDALYMPTLNYTAVDSVILSFDLTATSKDLLASPRDTLEVLVTKDCGTTFTSVYKKSGADLNTTGDVAYPLDYEYSPGTHPFLWRTETIDLTGAYAAGGPIQVVFRNTTNNQNDVYIDNVNLRTVVLPARLKAEGVIALPNPFSEQFNLWFVQAPGVSLQYVRVLNASGQMVYSQSFTGNNTNVIPINLTGKPAGVYVVQIGYANKANNKEIRIIKAAQ
jgi:hypothetical protein